MLRGAQTTCDDGGGTLFLSIWRKLPPSGSVADVIEYAAAAKFSSIQNSRVAYQTPVWAALVQVLLMEVCT